MHNNNRSDVNIITTDDLEVGVVLTDLYYNQLDPLPKITETVIINNSGFDVTITDCYGVVTTYGTRPIAEIVLDKCKLPVGFKGVVILERRSIKPTDIAPTMAYYNKYANTTRYTTRVERIHASLLNILNPNRLREYYVLYIMSSEFIRNEKCTYLRSPNLMVSLPGHEKRSPLMEDVNLKELFSNTPEISLGVSYTYYSREAGSVYINILGNVLRLDAVPPIDDTEEGVLIHRSHDGIIDSQLIKPEEFNTKFVFKSFREAKYNMSDENILAMRKVDLEFLKTESGFITSTLTEVSSVFKIRMDLSSKVLSAINERDKLARSSKTPSALDDIKKIVDIISMIGKIIL